ncbi:hypothetical protein K450DRAFT_248123 [Umbelopsis ramanniana AG]|uniref:Uncharacterized protein n=1 Tax=Umbelopsis ramanniana AG TaxID=1314678 RepID=A0AAD5E9U0_UMBRA|nr:uncharacterized protein K450DRAFT_248123 [Umbelopsis ramanniana AG]KAI8578290.1 hypothetical protein K450DRAFT_248123 [Umbelopsis ramanniana AG]
MKNSMYLLLSLAFLSCAMAQGSTDENACAAEPLEDYNMPLRIGTVFIILGTSSIGIFTPLLLHYFGKQDSAFIKYTLLIGKFFGTGVILATAFVHMLPDAFNNFANPCLPAGWLSYGAFGGVFCMIASLLIQLIEFAAIANATSINQKKAESDAKSAVENYKATDSITERTAFDQKNLPSHELAGDHAHEIGHFHTAGMLEEGQSFRNIGTLTLELGIVMHSVIIGITLANTGSDEFTTLLIALVFHQFFEGIALGTRINDMNLKSFLKPAIMSIAYCITTPLGIAIGIGIHSSFNENSPSSILAQAILDSLSAGILLYSAYVELIAMEMNHNPEFLQRSFGSKAMCFISLYTGAGLMALIGEWA